MLDARTSHALCWRQGIKKQNNINNGGLFMFVILLKFSENKSKAGELMEGHNEWIKRGFEDGVFLLVGSLQPNLGGSVIAHNASLSELQERIKEDPFVAENIVSAEILEIEPKKADERLNFLVV